MKALRILLLTVLSVFVTAYLAFLFVLPYSVDLNQYNPQIAKEIEKVTGFQVDISGLKVKTAWNLSGGALIDKTDLKYPKTLSSGEKFAQINCLEVKLSLIPFLMGQIKVDSVYADKFILNLDVQKTKTGDKFLLEKVLQKSSLPIAGNSSRAPKISDSMPNIFVKKYKINFIDIATGKDYAIKGADFRVSDFVLGKKIKVKTIGDLILNKRKQVSYNVAVFSKVMPVMTSQKGIQPQSFSLLTIFEDLYKYNLCANINTNLKITGNFEKPLVDGDLSLDNVKFMLKGKTLPPSNLKLKFNGENIKINFAFYTAVDEKALITGLFDNGRKKSINLKVVSNKTDIGNTVLIASSLLELIGRNDLKDIDANGHLNANFSIKSDFKKIQSSGFLKINNANVFHKLYKIVVKEICADIDFSENRIDIKKSSAKLDGKTFAIKGFVDKNANADISVIADNLQLKGLLATLGQTQILKENDILSGLINVDASIKGRLDKAIPTIDLVLSNVNLRNKPNKAQVKFLSAKIKMTSAPLPSPPPQGGRGKAQKTNGKIQLSGLKIYPQASVSVVSLPSMNLSFNEKDLNIDNATLFLNNSKIDIFGKVTDYATNKINTDITARGLMLSSDIKSMLPKANQKGVVAVGKIPLLIRITGHNKQEIHAQMLANQTNHLAVFDISSLKGKTSLINAQLTLDGNELKIHEITLYALGQNRGLSENMKSNSASGMPVVRIAGIISNINNPTPLLSGVSVSIPNQITTSIPGYSGSVVKVNGDLSLNGSVNNPSIKGSLALPVVYIPTIKMNSKNLVLNFNKNSIGVICPQLAIAKSVMSFNANVSNDFSKGILVNSVDLVSNYLDLDSLGSAFANLPQSSNAPGVDLGITILGGKGSVVKFKTGGIIATNVTSDFNLKKNWLNLNNVRADAYFGKIGGSVKYNLIYGNTQINLQGRKLSAGPAIKGLTGMPDSMTGQLDFDSNLSMMGYTQEQIISSMKGDTDFVISNGKLGQLGKLEHLLYAQNILSNNVFKATLNVIAKALTVKNTGLYKYINGKVTFSNGWANIRAIKASGPSMSMYITGRYNLLDNSANLVILGRLSGDVVRVLGPIGDLSMDKVLSYIPKIGAVTSFLINQMTTNPEVENTSMIPYLTPKTDLPTKDFKVVINGNVNRQSSVKSFKWLSTPQAATVNSQPSLNIPKSTQEVKQQVQEGARQILQQVIAPTSTQQYIPPKKIIAPVADFINALPDLKQ